ncbi:MAG TPA: HTH domain-containing protein [Polyangiaceae bacterium]|nr:HTH domain-containing protein [Polyangiaceae bacterium]
MTFIEAAAEVLRKAGKPLHYKEITELAIAGNLLSHVGKTPEVTMSHRLTSAIKKNDKEVPITKIRPGVFALREWEEKKGKKGAAAAAPEPTGDEANGEGVEVNALEIEAALRGASAEDDADRDDDEDDGEEDGVTEPTAVSGEDALRADLAASGADLFDDEDDDDQPILAPLSQPGAPAAQGEGGRRRRRRRRRGRGGSTQGELPGAGFSGAPGERPAGERAERSDRGERERSSQPRLDAAASASSASAAAPIDGEGGEARDLAAPRPVVRDRQQIMASGQPTGIDVPLGEGEELVGRDLADAAAIILSSFDRNAGPAPIRAVADALIRRGRLQGDPALAVAQAGASIRADNLRRVAAGQRARFRFASNGRVALTDWSLGGELPRLEQDVLSAVERYRDASRRALLRRLQELPGHALIELVLLTLERAGMTNLRPVRRSGSPGGEAHFAANHKTGGDAIPTAIVVRKDGREIGRERVTDLRGALHHYGPATIGWLVTTGQVLSGAREEAAAMGAPPVALYDGIALCKLLEEIEVGIVKTRFAIAIPDMELLEALRG